MIIETLSAGLLLLYSAQQTGPEIETPPEVATQQSAEPSTDADDEVKADIEVVEKRPEKITDRSHPDYIRCKSEPVIGFRAKRKRTCMSNREWEMASRKGNEASREFMRDNQPGFLGPGGR